VTSRPSVIRLVTTAMQRQQTAIKTRFIHPATAPYFRLIIVFLVGTPGLANNIIASRPIVRLTRYIMKKNLLLWLAAAISICTYAQQAGNETKSGTAKYTQADVAQWKKFYADMSLPGLKTDVVKKGLNGRVKKLTTIYYDVEENDGQQVLKKDFIDIENYNPHGFLTEQEQVFENSSYHYAFDYTDKDLVVAKTDLKDSSVASRFTYDKLLTGGVQKMEIKDGNYAKTTTIYNNDNITEIKTEKKDGQAPDDMRLNYKYDKSGNIIALDTYENGILTSSSRFEYNKLNVCTRTVDYDSKGIVQSTFEPKFDSNGRTIETNKIDKDQNVQKAIIDKYDEKNNKLSLKVYRNGKLNLVVEYEIEYY
jgi:hypothetical protein